VKDTAGRREEKEKEGCPVDLARIHFSTKRNGTEKDGKTGFSSFSF